MTNVHSLSSNSSAWGSYKQDNSYLIKFSFSLWPCANRYRKLWVNSTASNPLSSLFTSWPSFYVPFPLINCLHYWGDFQLHEVELLNPQMETLKCRKFLCTLSISVLPLFPSSCLFKINIMKEDSNRGRKQPGLTVLRWVTFTALQYSLKHMHSTHKRKTELDTLQREKAQLHVKW